MQEIVEEVIKAYCTEEFADAISDAYRVLDNFSVEILEDSLEEIALDVENRTSEDIADSIYKVVSDHIHYVIKNHGIKLSTECGLYKAIEITDCIYKMQNWDTPDEIVRIIESDASSIEHFAQLVALTSTIPEDTVYTLVDDVPPGFTRNLLKLSARVLANEQERSLDPEYIKRLRLLKKYLEMVHNLPSDKVMLFNIVSQGVALGSEFRFYYEILKHRLLASKDAEYLGYQYFALLAAGTDSSINMFDWWRKNNNNFFDDFFNFLVYNIICE